MFNFWIKNTLCIIHVNIKFIGIYNTLPTTKKFILKQKGSRNKTEYQKGVLIFQKLVILNASLTVPSAPSYVILSTSCEEGCEEEKFCISSVVNLSPPSLNPNHFHF